MLRTLFWLLFDAFFTFALIKFHDELGGYIALFLIAIAFFTWELICSIKQWLK